MRIFKQPPTRLIFYGLVVLGFALAIGIPDVIYASMPIFAVFFLGVFLFFLLRHMGILSSSTLWTGSSLKQGLQRLAWVSLGQVILLFVGIGMFYIFIWQTHLSVRQLPIAIEGLVLVFQGMPIWQKFSLFGLPWVVHSIVVLKRSTIRILLLDEKARWIDSFFGACFKTLWFNGNFVLSVMLLSAGGIALLESTTSFFNATVPSSNFIAMSLAIVLGIGLYQQNAKITKWLVRHRCSFSMILLFYTIVFFLILFIFHTILDQYFTGALTVGKENLLTKGLTSLELGERFFLLISMWLMICTPLITDWINKFTAHASPLGILVSSLAFPVALMIIGHYYWEPQFWQWGYQQFSSMMWIVRGVGLVLLVFFFILFYTVRQPIEYIIRFNGLQATSGSDQKAQLLPYYKQWLPVLPVFLGCSFALSWPMYFVLIVGTSLYIMIGIGIVIFRKIQI